MNVDMALRMAK